MNNTAKYLLTLAGGMVAGGILGLLFAPDKGSVTRNKVGDATRDLTDKIKKQTEKFAHKAKNKAEKEVNEFAN